MSARLSRELSDCLGDFRKLKSSDVKSLELADLRERWNQVNYWVNRAEDLFDRLPERHEELGVAIARGKAELMVRPEQVIRAMEQIKRGETIPAKELRNELRARLRA